MPKLPPLKPPKNEYKGPSLFVVGAVKLGQATQAFLDECWGYLGNVIVSTMDEVSRKKAAALEAKLRGSRPESE